MAEIELATSRQVVRDTPQFTDYLCLFVGGTGKAVGATHNTTWTRIAEGYRHEPKGAPDGQAYTRAVYRSWKELS